MTSFLALKFDRNHLQPLNFFILCVMNLRSRSQVFKFKKLILSKNLNQTIEASTLKGVVEGCVKSFFITKYEKNSKFCGISLFERRKDTKRSISDGTGSHNLRKNSAEMSKKPFFPSKLWFWYKFFLEIVEIPILKFLIIKLRFQFR